MTKRSISLVFIALALGLIGLMAVSFGCGGSSSSGGGPPPPPSAITPLYWPGYRGADLMGVTTDAVATTWTEGGGNVKWKELVNLEGASSPVVCENKVFLTGADATTREVYCYDATDGTLLWTSSIASATPTQTDVYNNITYAANTVVMDGTYVYAAFGNGDIAKLDNDTGYVRWVRSLGLPVNNWGHSSSLVLYNDVLIVQMDQVGINQVTYDDSQSRLIALNTANGATSWELADNNRMVNASWSTPLIINAAGKDQLITCSKELDNVGGVADVIAYDLATVTPLWWAKVLGVGLDISVTPIYVNSLVIVQGFGGVAALDPTGTGLVTNAWPGLAAVGVPDVGGLVGTGQRIYATDGYTAEAFCIDATNGNVHWTNDFGTGNILGSPIIINGNVYLLFDDGTMEVFSEAATFSSVATNTLTDGLFGATPAVANGLIYIRGQNNLYCIQP